MLDNEKNRRPNVPDSGNGSSFDKRSKHYNYTTGTYPSQWSNAAGTCQICGRKYRPNYYQCGILENGELARCSSVPSNKRDAKGRYLHCLKTDDFVAKVAPSIFDKPKLINHKLADSAQLDKVYRAFLEMLRLEPHHSDELLNERHLSDSAIVSNCYASVPTLEQARKVMKELSGKFDLTGVAGFFTNKRGDWLMSLCKSGYYVPIFNEEHQPSPDKATENKIVGLQIRLDSPEVKETVNDAIELPKYIWFSSSGKLNGTAQKMPLHFSKPHLVRFTNSIILTEGALKSQIIAEKLNFSVVGIAGTGISEKTAKEIADSLKRAFVYTEATKADNGAIIEERTIQPLQTIVLAPDADSRTNENVERAFRLLESALIDADFEVRRYEWKLERGKGLDDALIADEKLCEVLRYDE